MFSRGSDVRNTRHILVLLFDLGLNGAILTILASYIIRIIVQLYFAKPKLQNNNTVQVQELVRIQPVAHL